MTHRSGTLLTRLCALLLAICPFGGAQTQQPAEPPPDSQAAEIFVRTVSVREGVDRCVVCSTLLKAGDKVYLVEGQRVGIMEEMEPQLFGEPWTFIGRLKPRGGLFGGEMAPASGISDAWLLLGIYVTMGLGFAAVCAHRAINTGQEPVRWFAAGFLFNAFGYLALLLRAADAQNSVPPEHAGVTKVPATSEPLTCPSCGHLNHPSAAECLGCHASLTAERPSEVTQLARNSNLNHWSAKCYRK